jgi:hypothetical protein
VLDHYNKAQEYLKQGNWAGYGKELQDMKAVLTEMSKENGVNTGKPAK